MGNGGGEVRTGKCASTGEQKSGGKAANSNGMTGGPTISTASTMGTGEQGQQMITTTTTTTTTTTATTTTTVTKALTPSGA